MRDWETKRASDISESILVTHIISLLIFLMILFSFFNLPLGIKNPTAINYLFIFFCLGAVIYTARKLLAKFTILDQSRIDELLLLAVLLPITFGFIWYSNGFAGAKVLIVIPAIITATAFGKVIGSGEALLSCGLLFLLDYLLGHGLPDQVFQADIIITGVTVLLAWVVGGLIEVERNTQQELVRLADYDPLTGLISYRYLQEKLAISVQNATAQNSTLSLVLMDIDQFKYYNAVYGYQKGDEILTVIGRLLLDEVQEPFYAARYGNDEFMLVLPGQDKENARNIAVAIRQRLVERATAVLLENQPTSSWRDFTISISVVGCPEDGDDALQLIRTAENDLFRIKYSEGMAYLYQSVVSEIGALQIKDAFPALQTFIALINSKDKYTYGHSERVISYALALADKLNLTNDEKDTLRFAAYLHDIGKIEIETGLLTKETRLNKEEWKTMENHPILGSEMLKPLISFLPVVPIIRSHHENYDGSGYPDKCRGEDIPLMARILRIADSFDAMTTNRPYRKAMPLDEACAELQARAGTWYDDHLVQLFLDVVKNIYQQAS
ncbi:MAG: HD domain-containing phosphohydrolase [Thermacetogeniaceae bacterium]